MLSEQCVIDLNAILNYIRIVGVKYMNARNAFKKASDMGICAMLKNETMERWGITGMLRDFLIKEGGDVTYTKTPAPPKMEADLAHLRDLLAHDLNVVTMIDEKITSAMNRGSFNTVLFLKDIRYCYKDEHDEMKNRIDDLAQLDGKPDIVMYDNYLLEEYSNRDYQKYDFDYC